MFKLVVMIIKIAVIVAAAIWLAGHTGSLAFEFGEYRVTMHLGVALVGLLAFLLLSIGVYRVYSAITHAPKTLNKYNAQRRNAKGQRALSLGMTAVAAGDAKVAAYQAYRAQKFLGEDSKNSGGLVLLLDAQAHRLNGDEAAANKSFAALIQNPETAFLGVRGLLQAALDHEQYDKARDYAEEALRLHPKQPWILRIVYDLEVRDQNWSAALGLLKRLEKVGGFSKIEACEERAAMETAQGLDFAADEKFENAAHHYRLALKQEAGFSPAALLLADLYERQDKQAKLRALLEKSIKADAHPELIARWATFGRVQYGDDALAQMQWMERLKKLSSSVNVVIALAETAIDAALWGEARGYLNQAQTLSAPNVAAKVFILLVRLEEETDGDDVAIASWLEEAANAPADPVWFCSASKMTLPEWQPFSPFDGAFNSVIWGYPFGVLDQSFKVEAETVLSKILLT